MAIINGNNTIFATLNNRQFFIDKCAEVDVPVMPDWYHDGWQELFDENSGYYRDRYAVIAIKGYEHIGTPDETSCTIVRFNFLEQAPANTVLNVTGSKGIVTDTKYEASVLCSMTNFSYGNTILQVVYNGSTGTWGTVTTRGGNTSNWNNSQLAYLNTDTTNKFFIVETSLDDSKINLVNQTIT